MLLCIDVLSLFIQVPLQDVHDTTERITPEMLAMEQRGQHSHMVALHGVITGMVTVQCEIHQKPFLGVEPALVKVTITEALQVRPSQPVPLIVAPFASFDFTLLAWRGRRQAVSDTTSKPRAAIKPHVFSMPSVQYKWRSENTQVLPIDTDMGRVVAVELGDSMVHVEDQHLELNKQTSLVTVSPTSRIAT